MFLQSITNNSKRVKQLKRLINKKGFIRIIEAHNGLSGLIGEKLQINNGPDLVSFDGFWESSLTDSASKGMPDIELVSIDSRLNTLQQIMEVTSKPVIFDGDTGGDINQFTRLVSQLERMGVSMIIIEDKMYPKRNSFADSPQSLEDIKTFSEKIARGMQIKQDKDFLIIARLESLIVGETMENALYRAKAFLQAGADGVMIHSKSKNPSEILEFAELYKKLPKRLTRNKLLVCVPTTYNTITTKELAAAGFQVIIYANHLLRASYQAMETVCKEILTHDRGIEAEELCITIKKLFEAVGMQEIIDMDIKNIENKAPAKVKLLLESIETI